MTVYEFTGRRLRRPHDEEDLTRGDTFEADEDDPIVQGFSDLFRETDESSADYSASDDRVDTYDLGDDGDDEPAEPEGGGEPADEAGSDDVDSLLEGTVDEVEQELESGDYDDQLDELEERAERQGVLDAVEERRD